MGSITKMCSLKATIFSLILHLVSGSPEDISSSCPPHWQEATWVDMGCLLFNSTTELTWLDANSYCQTQEDAVLVEILTEEQHQFVKSMLSMLEEHEGQKNWWTGGNDIGREGKWSWISSQTPVGDFLWHTGYPIRNMTDINFMYLHSSWGYESADTTILRKLYPICQKV